MIVLDTNVISELMRPQPDPVVSAWITGRPRDSLHTTSINRAEILYGVAILPEGRRRDRLAAPVDAMFAVEFSGRVLPFDAAAAACYARVVSGRRRIGSPIEGFDALIAAVALAVGATVATRDVGGFTGCGVPIVDPWRPDATAAASPPPRPR